jgi:hypothetical protein
MTGSASSAPPKRCPTIRATRTCVFAGPSTAGQALDGFQLRPPATRGAVIEAVRSGFTRIAFIDGAIDHRDQVPLRELRLVLAIPEVQLFGAASMGAIRAVQLANYGMRGAGRVYRLFRHGVLTDSDEVFLLHAPAALRYRPLTLPLVNIRYTLRAMRRGGELTAGEARALAAYMRDVPWFDRDTRSVVAAVFAICGSTRRRRVMKAFEIAYRDVKREDAVSLLSMLQGSDSRSAANECVGIRQ